METNFSFDETNGLYNQDFGNEDFGNEGFGIEGFGNEGFGIENLDNQDFGIDSEYFENEEYIDEIIEKPLVKSTTNVLPIPNVLKSTTNITPILKTTTNVKKSNTVSYDDILKSLNVTLVNGKLVLSKGTPNTVEQVKEENTSKKVKFANQEPIPQEVKNSAIYNKYFKTYNSIQPTVEVRRPKTIEEYRQMLLEDKIKRIQANRRIAMIKSKKLMFSRENSPVINMSQPTNLNKLFNFPR
jgi:hypothetical protein